MDHLSTTSKFLDTLANPFSCQQQYLRVSEKFKSFYLKLDQIMLHQGCFTGRFKSFFKNK